MKISDLLSKMAEVKLLESKVSFYKKKAKWVSFHKKRIHKPRHKRSKDFKVGAELSGFNSSRLKVLVTCKIQGGLGLSMPHCCNQSHCI